jgi:hypothetical protein
MRMSVGLTGHFLSFMIAANAVVVVSGMVISAFLRRRLKVLNRARWEALGRPSFLLNNSIGNNLRFRRYIFGSGHRELNDPTFDRLALASKLIFCLVGVLFAAALAMILWTPHVHSIPSPPVGSTRNHPLSVAGVAILVLFAVVYAADIWLLRRLKRTHQEIWMQLGSPSLVTNHTISNSWEMLRFVWSVKHRTLSDTKLSIAIYMIRCLSVVMIFTLLVLGPLAFR